MFTIWFSISSARPFSRGSDIIVILFLLFGVSAKHFKEDVSTTVSQNETTGSATLISGTKNKIHFFSKQSSGLNQCLIH